ncbi:MAG: PLP-dependent aminotransferase family protein [Phormidesmis sp.]
MKIPLDRRAKKPIYLQIRDRIQHLIHQGHLIPGSQLPSIRTLAQTVQVNKLTVIEAYSVLEADGLVCAKPGAGYFINPPALQSTSSRRSTFNPVQEVLLPNPTRNSFPQLYYARLQSEDDTRYIDFSLGFPQPTGVDDLQRIARRAMKEAPTFFHSGHPQGDLTLRARIVQILIQQGLEILPENLIITNGSMQALSLLVEHLISPSDWVVVEAPSYHGFLSILQQRRAQVIGIPMTPEGMNLELLEQYLKSHRPKLIYTISTLHNPTGITTSVAHRQKLLSLAEQYDCLIVEDNAYEPLSFDITPPPIKAFDRRDRVIYLGTFSKTLMPGLRVGYMAVTGKETSALTERKLLHDFHSSHASQAIVKEYLASGHYRRRLNQIQALHRDRRDCTLKLLAAHFPDNLSWTVPDGGTFLWIQLPDTLSVSAVSAAAAARKVLVCAGSAFFPAQQGYSALRLNFALPPSAAQRGIQILGDVLKKLQ